MTAVSGVSECRIRPICTWRWSSSGLKCCLRKCHRHSKHDAALGQPPAPADAQQAPLESTGFQMSQRFLTERGSSLWHQCIPVSAASARATETESSEHAAAASSSPGGIRGLGNGVAEGGTCLLALCDRNILPFRSHQRCLPFPWPQRYRKGPGRGLEDLSQETAWEFQELLSGTRALW